MTSALARTTAVLAAQLLALGTAVAGAAGATAATSWAAADVATIHPGVQTVTDGAQCTANFVFTDGTRVLLGQAAHCAGTGGSTDTNGCEAGSRPLGTAVEVQGADRPGTLVYSSWLTMQAVGETDANTCRFNDVALVELHPDDHDKVNPSLPFWGGPTRLGTATAAGEDVFGYGNSSLRLGLSLLSPKQGISLGQTAGGWNHPVYTATPGIPGDSGSAFLNASGEAVGVLSTLAIAPLAGSNGVSDLALALAYAREHTALSPVLATGTEPFQPLLP